MLRRRSIIVIGLSATLLILFFALFSSEPENPWWDGPMKYPLSNEETLAAAERKLLQYCKQMNCELSDFTRAENVQVQDASPMARAMALVTYTLKNDPKQIVWVTVAWDRHAEISGGIPRQARKK